MLLEISPYLFNCDVPLKGPHYGATWLRGLSCNMNCEVEAGHK
jgi:hypothetical protein